MFAVAILTFMMCWIALIFVLSEFRDLLARCAGDLRRIADALEKANR